MPTLEGRVGNGSSGGILGDMPAQSLDLARVKAMTLDLDETLWPIWPTIRRAEQALHEWLIPRAPRAAALSGERELQHALRAAVLAEHPEQRHDLGFVRREAIRRLLAHAGEDEALAAPGFEVFFAERQKVELFPDAREVLPKLAARFALVAVSNGNADIGRVGIAEHFVGHVSAHEAGCAKPDPAIFHMAARVAGVDPGDILHVGDDAELDVAGAHGAGMQVVWINRAGHVLPEDVGAPHAEVRDLRALAERLGLHVKGAAS